MYGYRDYPAKEIKFAVVQTAMIRRSFYSQRQYFVIAIILGIFLIYLIKLFYIQVISDKYRILAESNVRRTLVQYPPRGVIYDRNGKVLVTNEPAYDLMVIPRQVKNPDTAELCRLLDIETKVFRDKLRKARGYSPYKASIFIEQLSRESYGFLQEKLYKFPGFFVQPRTLRRYPQATAANVLGYVGEVNPAEIEANPYYKMGDYVGKSGIEKSYEKELRGEKGLRIVMVDVFNREKGRFEEGRYDQPQVQGKDLTSSIDLDLQLYAEKLMAGKRGSIVAIEPATGEILAMVTAPSYDPNLLIGRKRAKNYSQLVNDEQKPLFNRAIQATYPPGSTFKLVVGLVGLEEGVLTPATRYGCSGKASKPIACTHSHYSPLDLIGAIEQSCNPYFWNVFRTSIDRFGYTNTSVGFTEWRRMVTSFGFSTTIAADLLQQSKGNIPTIKYYDKYFGKNGWRSLTVRSLAIGQGEILVTPLQLANLSATIANRGFYYSPHIVKKVAGVPLRFEKKVTAISPNNFLPVIEGMEHVFQGGSGTARWYAIDSIIACGKTGTVQNPHGKDHSLFIAFAPRENPRIAISVVIENAGFGATWAVPIASLILERYLKGRVVRPELEERMSSANLIGE